MKPAAISFAVVCAVCGLFSYHEYIYRGVFGRYKSELSLSTQTQIRSRGSQLCGVGADLGRGQSYWNEYELNGAIYYFSEILDLEKEYYVIRRWDAIKQRRGNFVTTSSPLNATTLTHAALWHLFFTLVLWMIAFGTLAHFKVRGADKS